MQNEVLIIGGGAAGLMAADAALRAGASVTLAEAKPSLARKVLMAGKSGLNLTKDEPLEDFVAHYSHDFIADLVREFPPSDIRKWADDYDAQCFTGSSGKVFPKAMKASPLLRAWILDLQARGLDIRTRWRWIGERPGDFRFETPQGEQVLHPQAAVFALGGASWPRLGSDGAWTSKFPTVPFRAANMGVNVNWSEPMTPFFGHWLKNIVARSGVAEAKGEIGFTRHGLEGGAVYALSENLQAGGALTIDLKPQLGASEIAKKFSKRGKMSLANFLRKLGLSDAARAMFFECSHSRNPLDLKELKVNISGLRPIEEAISTAGGVSWDALSTDLSMTSFPNVFLAGEMLDWTAPTGGYLLTACLATGRKAGENAAQYALARTQPSP